VSFIFVTSYLSSLQSDKILPLLAPSYNIVLKDIATADSNSQLQHKRILLSRLEAGLKLTDEILANLVSEGFVALAERNQIDNEKLVDWSDDMADIQLSIPLDGDITLNSQVLLQEQGFRVYPDFARFAITSAFQQALANMDQNVSSDEYYMDTDYSSDPDQFEVKQVLLNIVIDSN
jgi:ribosomal protein S8